jgi:hypothetical protein
MKTTTKRQQSRSAMECDALRKENGCLQLALWDVMDGNIHWIRHGKHKVGITRPAGPSGGIVIECGPGYGNTHFFEDWFPHWENYVPHPSAPEGLIMRDLAYRARAYIQAAQVERVCRDCGQ